MKYSNYAVYNLRPHFSKQPGQPNHCLKCGGILSVSNINPSESIRRDLENFGLIPVHFFTLLFSCNSCHWWCVRENWSLFECHSDCDYLIVGVNSNQMPSDVESEKPWLEALADPEVYDYATNLPRKIAAIFPGVSGISKMRKLSIFLSNWWKSIRFRNP